MSSFDVFINNAKNLPNLEYFDKSDPYAIVEYKGRKFETAVKKSDLNPVWDEKFTFNLEGRSLNSSDKISVTVMDKENIGNDRLLGQTDIHLKDLSKNKTEVTMEASLVDSNSRPNASIISLKIIYHPPRDSNVQFSGDTDEHDHSSAMDKNRRKSIKQTFDEEEDEETVAEDEDMDNASGKTKHKKKKGKSGKRKLRSNYSNKIQDFQVRIKVIEARQLQGANISPVTKVTCWNQTKQTRVKNSTNSPFWGDTFFFNFHVSPADLFDELITFSVYNSRRLRNDAMIGSFKFDLGMIYEDDGHCFLNKWLLLYDHDDPMAGAKGYLKFSAAILGPGDEAPSFAISTADEEDDIETNLLRPAGVQLRPATFTLRVYRGEDLPRMDSDMLEGIKKVFTSDVKKELVDPYLVFQFAGKEIKTSTKYNNDHPEWNEELKIGLQFPSMCERIKLQLFDWDRVTEDDVIGTAVIDLTTIGAQGENGYLPTFGPCFINFYGSPREFSNLPDKFEALNYGKGEGVAYRGRLLVELTTTLDETPEREEIVEVHQDNLLKVQKYVRRRKYRLHSAFLSASMITAIDSAVEFEVSIGNYGNKLDETAPPSSSTTQPTNAVFDGSYYHFLPWGHSKPATLVECHYEDISFRLFAVNFFLRIIDKLGSNMNKIRVAIKANLPEEEQAQFVISAFDDLIVQCSGELPQWETGQSPQNELDLNLYHLRQGELKFIRKEAMRVREEATSVEQALNDLDAFMNQLKNLAVEPQNSMPDVVIWMITGSKRTVYHRIPAYDVLFSPNHDYMGRYCGAVQTINLKIPSIKDSEIDDFSIPAQLRLKIWLGQEKEEVEWYKMHGEAELCVVAETYENQASLMGKWTTRAPTMTRSAWTDASGRIELRKETIQPPVGWEWSGDWYISPELSLLYDKDAGLSHYLEDVFVNESRTSLTQWAASTVQFTDVKGDPNPAPKDVVLPTGWEWEDDWQVDLNRPCDEEGWEYTVEASLGGYVPVMKSFHMCRRRRYVRARRLIDESQTQDAEEQKVDDDEYWEYAPLFELRFHAKERKTDLVRRRRWHRKMKSIKSGVPSFTNIGQKDSEKGSQAIPRMFLVFKKPQKWQMRAYIYQARNLLAGDQTGFSDPYARVALLSQSQSTERIDKTLCPTWDQTLIYHQMEIHGEPSTIVEYPPYVAVEIFDYDSLGEDEFLGRCQINPMVKTHPDDPRKAVLQWYKLYKGNREAGELLAAFELYLTSQKALPYTPPRRGNVYTVPDGIRPLMQRTGIEILAWGVRNMSKFQLSSVSSPSIEFEIGGHVKHTDVIKNTATNPNFGSPLMFLDVLLPKEELYMPPLNIKVRDNRQFGRKPLVGMHVLDHMDEYRVDPITEESTLLPDFPDLPDSTMDTDDDTSSIKSHTKKPKKKTDSISSFDVEHTTTHKSPKKKKKFKFFKMHPKIPRLKKEELDLSLMDEDIDWWSKYYASLGEWSKCHKYAEMNYDTLKVFKTELEKVEGYNDFTDFCSKYLLYRGKNLDDEEEQSVGEFKGTFRIYELPEDRTAPLPTKYLERGLPSTAPVECLIRVYIVKAIELQPNDPSGLADPYVEVQLGRKIESSKDSYIPNTLCPEFGRMFEIKATIPIVKDLEIRVKDYDLMSTDDVIGETTIDLENRLLTKFRATCGLPHSYSVSGPNQWRDCRKPSEILEEFCKANFIPEPIYEDVSTTNGSTSDDAKLTIGQRQFRLSQFETHHEQHKRNPHRGVAKERLSLHILNALPLVKEHVETRPLYSPLQPGIEQGKLQCWVDIFPCEIDKICSPYDITPRKPRSYELRVIIWNTKDVILEEENLMGEKMSDIYVKGWLAGIDERQETDVHYRSLDGEGNFNWRFVFPFDYLPAENMMVVRRKEHFWSLDETEQRLPCNAVLQIWDNDKFSADDFLGTLELNLAHMPAPAKKSRLCDLNQLQAFNPNQDVKHINLFECHRAYGYWPCYNDETGTAELTGKIEMELELLSKDDAESKPAGLGRDEPNENPKLDPPKRPDTSFLWFTSPWKTFKFIIWKNFKWYFIGGIIIILVGLIVVLFIYAIPGLTARKIIL